MKKYVTSNRPLDEEQLARLARLDDMPDEDIDFSDIPEITDEQWAGAIRPGRLGPGRPVALWLDPATLKFFEQNANSRPMQAEMTRVLQRYAVLARKKSA